MLISSLNPDDIVPFPQGGDGTDPDDTADGWEGGFFLGASHAKNVTISGMGTIYGQGDKVFLDKDADNGFHECPKFCDVFRPRMMLFEAVENFTVRDVTLQDAAFWTCLLYTSSLLGGRRSLLDDGSHWLFVGRKGLRRDHAGQHTDTKSRREYALALVQMCIRDRSWGAQ